MFFAPKSTKPTYLVLSRQGRHSSVSPWIAGEIGWVGCLAGGVNERSVGAGPARRRSQPVLLPLRAWSVSRVALATNHPLSRRRRRRTGLPWATQDCAPTGPIFRVKARLLHVKNSVGPEQGVRRWRDLADSFPRAPGLVAWFGVTEL